MHNKLLEPASPASPRCNNAIFEPLGEYTPATPRILAMKTTHSPLRKSCSDSPGRTHLGEEAVPGDAGIVDDDIDRPEVRLELLHARGFNRRRVAIRLTSPFLLLHGRRLATEQQEKRAANQGEDAGRHVKDAEAAARFLRQGEQQRAETAEKAIMTVMRL